MAEVKKVTNKKEQEVTKTVAKSASVKSVAMKPATKAVADVKKPAVSEAKKSTVADAKKTVAIETKKTVAEDVKKTSVSNATKTVTLKKPTAPKKMVKKSVSEHERGLRKTRTGKVVSNKMNKTIVVEIVNKVPHPLYGKVVVTTTKFKAHDENNECSIGDTVEIMETRPLSRDKYFRLLRIVEKVK